MVLGVEIPSESFVPENPPIEGTNPSTGEFWQLVGTHPIIEQILVRFLEPIPNAHLEVTDYSVVPDGVAPLPPGELANAYFSFTARNFDDGDIRATHLSFSVEKSWLRDNLINPWSVRFNRYDEDRRTWVLLDAKRVGEDEFLVHYTAYPPGFHIWPYPEVPTREGSGPEWRTCALTLPEFVKGKRSRWKPRWWI